jgi:purine catabolism regulator
LGKRGSIIDALELGIYRLMLEATDSEALRSYVTATLRPLLEDGLRGRELLETLQAYVASGFNQREAARRCYAHINTIANRLERISQKFGRDLSDPEVRMDLAVALRLAKLMDIL